MNATNVVRINITVPKTLLSELEKEVSVRGKSSFISKAVEEKLIRDRRANTLKKRSSFSPTYLSIKDSADYVRKMRKYDDRKRSKKLMG